MNKITSLIVVVTLIIVAAFLYFKMTPAAQPQTSSDADKQASSIVDALYGTTTPGTIPTQDTTATPPATTSVPSTPQKVTTATIHTNKGDITFKFSPEIAPNTVANFVKLASAGFYNGTKFHRVIKGFMIQGGDPFTKDDSKIDAWGTGGPGYTFKDEITSASLNVRGTVSMANSGPNTDGSQFFINVVDNHFLDGKYTVFGVVTKGMDVAEAIDNTQTDSNDRPVSPVIVTSVTLK